MPTRVFIAALCAAAVLALAACGDDDESAQEKAQNQVCDARADVKKQVDELASLDLGTATVDGIKQNLNAITDDLSKMRDARGDLSDDRRAQIESATKTFTSELKSVVDSLGSTQSLSGALTQVQNSLVALRDSYREALEPIDCG